MLNLGRVYNILHDDKDAIKWFDLASKSPDPASPPKQPALITTWRPSSRSFELRCGSIPSFPAAGTIFWLRPGEDRVETRTASRFTPTFPCGSMAMSAARPSPPATSPQYLSELVSIFALGAATIVLGMAPGWFEAGEAVNLQPTPTFRLDDPRLSRRPLLRQGLRPSDEQLQGLVFETNDDGVFVSRFQDDMLLYSQNRAGYTLAIRRVRRPPGAALLERQLHG